MPASPAPSISTKPGSATRAPWRSIIRPQRGWSSAPPNVAAPYSDEKCVSGIPTSAIMCGIVKAKRLETPNARCSFTEMAQSTMTQP